jgi:hypothetical protein
MHSFADYACPARDPVKTTIREAYNPSAVNWGAVVADIIQIGKHEPRFCNMVIRSWFHDVSGFSNGRDENFPFDGASDGSAITDFNEIDGPDGALHGFGQFSRHVILQVMLHCVLISDVALNCLVELCTFNSMNCSSLLEQYF